MPDNQTNFSRREFAKRGSAAAAAAGLFSIVTAKTTRAAVDIKIGLLGCGGRGRGALDDVLRAGQILEMDNIHIVAVADVFEDQTKRAQNELKEKWNIDLPDSRRFHGFDGYKDLLEQDINYVMLCTPPVFRPPTLEAAVEAGKHIFMEKPAAVDAPGIRRIIAAAERAESKGLSIAAGTQRRHQGEYVATIEKIHGGAIGEVMNAQAYWCGGPIGFRETGPDATEMEKQIRSWYHYLWLSGDHIVEQHVHNLDVINWIAGGHPVKAYGHGGRAWQQRGNIWDHHAVQFEYENGLQLYSLCSQFPREDTRVQEAVQGTEGVSNCRNWIKNRDGEWKFEEDFVNPYVQEHVDLITSIQTGKPINEATNIAIGTMTAIMGRMAEYSGRELTWDEAFNSDENLGLDKYELGPVKLAPVAVPGGAEYTGKEGWNPG